MSRIWLSLVVRSRLTVALLLLGALLCFGLGQVLGHPLSAMPPSSRVSRQAQAAARQIGVASGTLAATPISALAQPMPLAAPPARPVASAGPPAHHNGHAKGKHHQGNGGGGAGGGSKQGGGHHHSNGGGNHGGNGGSDN